MDERKPTTYWDYIRVEDLLSLQDGLERDAGRISDEEVLFITVHQVFELWFKLILADLRAARDLFRGQRVRENELSGVVARLRRVTTILRSAAQHFEVVESLSTRAYLEFRDKLMPASGFQSAQMRQMELLFGLREEERVPLGGPSSHLDALRGPKGEETESLRSVLAQLADRPSLREAVHAWLARTPIGGVPHDDPESDARVERFLEEFLASHHAQLEATCEHHLALVEDPAAQERVRQSYDWTRRQADEFLHTKESVNGVSSSRVRAAMLFIETYRDLPLLAWPREVLAGLVEVEQAFVIFRQRHARMVERVIGRRTGTGGSSGVDYLDRTALEYRIFKDLWQVRTLLLRPTAAPDSGDPDFYQFRAQ